MHFEKEHQEPFIHIRRFRDLFASTNAANTMNTITDPLNESDFFDEWTPQTGEWVEVSTKEDPENYSKRQYLCTIDGKHLCVDFGGSITSNNQFIVWQHIRQIKPETMTLQEAQDKLREVLNKPNLVITE
jgi:hypothetical protein